MTKYLIAAAVFALVGCAEQEQVSVDQCSRKELFKQCMSALPKGPERVGTSNDWDEVVSTCDSIAVYQSKRKAQYIKPECRL